jgi:hypothetical protein
MAHHVRHGMGSQTGFGSLATPHQVLNSSRLDVNLLNDGVPGIPEG